MSNASLAELVEVRSSLDDPTSPENVDLPHVGPEHIPSGAGHVEWEKVRTCGDDGVISGKYIFQPGDILYSKIRPYLNKVARADRVGMCSADMYALVPQKKVHAGYLLHVLQSPLFLDATIKFSGRANIPKINRSQLLTIGVPLPSLSQQERIAAILNAADALRAKRRAALAKLDTLAQSIFIETFGQGQFPRAQIGEICSVLGGKRQPKGEEYAADPTPYRYIRVADFSSGVIDPTNVPFIKPEVFERIKRYRVEQGDVVISIAGSTGIVAVVPNELVGANLTENAARLHAKTTETHTAHYLAAALRTKNAQSQIGARVGQVTIGKLALFRIEQISIPLPPLSLQKQFDERLEAIIGLSRELADAAFKTDAMFASLQHRAFTGKL